jgi:porin
MRPAPVARAVASIAAAWLGLAVAPAFAADAPGLTGDWGGLRTSLSDAGVDVGIAYVSESAWNPAGGVAERVRETGQLTIGTKIDAERLVGLAGGTFQATVTWRRGENLGAAAGLPVLQQVQEVWGRGQTWRLTQFWYQQAFGAGSSIKLGRMTVGEDFAAFSCSFMNLSFCGSPPGNLAGDYWYNWPVSQWGARLHLSFGPFYARLGAYEVNPRNLDNQFFLGRFDGATGVMVPAEAGYRAELGPDRLPGTYLAGGWWNSADADDVLLDRAGGVRPLTGLDPLRREGRHGVYLQFRQQMTGTATTTAEGRQTVRGLVAFLNVTQTDRSTTVTDNQIALGLFFPGLFPARPADELGLAMARTHVNGRAADAQMWQGAERPTSEYAAELYYGWRPASWIVLRPNVQYVLNPGGLDRAPDVVILGMKGEIRL